MRNSLARDTYVRTMDLGRSHCNNVRRYELTSFLSDRELVYEFATYRCVIFFLPQALRRSTGQIHFSDRRRDTRHHSLRVSMYH